MQGFLMAFGIAILISLSCSASNHQDKKPVVTYITGLWDVNRGNLGSRFTRSYEYYLKHFAELLQTESNLIIYGDDYLQEFVKQHRLKDNTVFIRRDLEWFKNQWYTPMVEKIINRLN